MVQYNTSAKFFDTGERVTLSYMEQVISGFSLKNPYLSLPCLLSSVPARPHKNILQTNTTIFSTSRGNTVPL